MKKYEFTQLKQNDKCPSNKSNIEILKEMPLNIRVILGETFMKIDDILKLTNGSIIELDKLAGENIDIEANGKLIAKGEVVIVNEKFAIRIKDIIERK